MIMGLEAQNVIIIAKSILNWAATPHSVHTGALDTADRTHIHPGWCWVSPIFVSLAREGSIMSSDDVALSPGGVKTGDKVQTNARLMQ